MNFLRLCDFDILVNKKEESDQAVVVLHGFGASAQDLAPISQVFTEFSEYDWYFIDAPLEVPLGMGMMGKAWYPLDMEAIQQAIATNSFLDLYKDNTPDGFEDILSRLTPLMNELSTKYKNLALGGFSQGSIVSSHLMTRLEKNFSKLFLFSSAYVDQKNLEKGYQSKREMKIFQSHGEGDPVLPFAGALELKKFFLGKQYDLNFQSFTGGHEIPMPVLEQFKSFLEG